MVIQNNIASMYGDRMLKNTNYKLNKSAQKLSSGYRINSAADNAAGLAISEKMRGQIRGLNRAKDNVDEGIHFVETVDGVMGEVTSMVHRMQELTVQALNDTNTEEDKLHIQQEIDQLSQEINRMANQSECNTMKVFERHEPTYSSFKGVKTWSIDALHTVIDPNNTLEVALSEQYDPSEVRVTIPDGTYTTLELTEQIEEQLREQQPEETRFVFEYAPDSVCNLTFEGGTEIEKVQGALAYLFYDITSANDVGNLIGTTQIVAGAPLMIVAGQNDELKFTVDDMNGNTYSVGLTLAEGPYTKEDLIDALNKEFEAQGNTDLVAKEHGADGVMVSAGASLITGLKGNMFRIEKSSETIYNSAFYDNAMYGEKAVKQAKVTGEAYYNTSLCSKISITQDNNKLSFRLKGETNYTTITIPEGRYTVYDLYSTLSRKLSADQKKTWNFSYTSSYRYVNNCYGYYNSLILMANGEASNYEIEFDTSTPVEDSTYKSLFVDTYMNVRDGSGNLLTAQLIDGSDTYYRSGRVYTAGQKVELTAQNGTFQVSCSYVDPVDAITKSANTTIELGSQTYADVNELVNDINASLALNLTLKDRVKAQYNTANSRLEFVPVTKGDLNVKSISCSPKDSTTYTELFNQNGLSYYSGGYYSVGKDVAGQGNTRPVQASFTLNYSLTTSDTVINDSNDTLILYVDGKKNTVKLTHGTYSQSAFVSELNRQVNPLGVTVSLSGSNALTFTRNQAGSRYSIGISSYNTGDTAVSGALMTPIPVVRTASRDTISASYIISTQPIANDFEITATNDYLKFSYSENGSRQTYEIKLEKKTYATVDALVQELQSKIDARVGSGKIKVSKTTDGKLKIATEASDSMHQLSDFDGGFYEFVINSKNKVSKAPTYVSGSVGLSPTYVVGRADIKNNPVTIKSGVNDELSIDMTYLTADNTPTMVTLTTKLPAGTYSGADIATKLQEGLNQQLQDKSIDGFSIKAAVGAVFGETVAGFDPRTVVSFQLESTDASKLYNGTKAYKLDGVSGSAAYSVFYKTSGIPRPASVTGTRNVSDGVEITDENNQLQFNVDGVDYSYTFPNGTYTATEFENLFKQMLQQPDENGQTAPVDMEITDAGTVKLSHQKYGNHVIKDITGGMAGYIFFSIDNQVNKSGMRIQAGSSSGQEIVLNKIALSLSQLKLDAIDVTRHSHAQYALKNLSYAVDYLNGKRSLYGAKENRLEAAKRLAENASLNLQSAESQIRDTDMADAIMDYSKEQILRQENMSVLAQAN